MAGTDGRLRFFFVGMTSLPALSRSVTKLLLMLKLLSKSSAVHRLVLVQFHDEPAALLLLE